MRKRGEIVQSDINPGTILLNRDIPDHGGIRNSTLAHEASHSFLGRYFFLQQKGGAERLPCVAVNDFYS